MVHGCTMRGARPEVAEPFVNLPKPKMELVAHGCITGTGTGMRGTRIATLRQSFVNNFLEIAFDDAGATATAAALDYPFPRLVLKGLPY